MDQDQQDQPSEKPIAYDAEGRPLYAAPQSPKQQRSSGPRSHITSVPESLDGHNFNPRVRVQYANEPHVFHATRPYDPVVGEVSPEQQRRHELSAERYPNLNLSPGEYVILGVKRHPIGLWGPLAATIATIMILLAVWVTYPELAEINQQTGQIVGIEVVSIIIFSLIVLVGLFGYISAWVYMRNTLFLTNESVIQEIQHGIFSKHEQTVSLGSVEDASYRQFGIWQSLFNYGTIRLSTEGEETSYRFQYASNPKKQIAVLNNAIECFKNGRPIGSDFYEDD